MPGGDSAHAAEPFDRGLLSPGTAHSGLVSDDAIVAALIRVEVALVAALERVGAAPRGIAARVEAAIEETTDSGSLGATELSAAAVAGGNPVIPLVAALRRVVAWRDPEAARWVHRGATSQDVLDSALMLVSASVVDGLIAQLRHAAAAAGVLADRHRRTLQVGRTLTQHSTPIVFGMAAAQWTLGLVEATDGLAAVRGRIPVQLGGASGNLAGLVEVIGADAAANVASAFAAELGLHDAPPWHVRRAPITRLGDALVTAIDAGGVIATDVVLLARPEIGELSEAEGGGSSTMPQKQNPVASILLRSLSLRAPGLAADLHRSASTSVDQRPDGAWHAEWPALRELLRLSIGAAELVDRIVTGLQVDEARMLGNLRDAGPAVFSERISLAEGSDAAAAFLAEPGDHEGSPLLDPFGYLGLSDRIIDDALAAVAT